MTDPIVNRIIREIEESTLTLYEIIYFVDNKNKFDSYHVLARSEEEFWQKACDQKLIFQRGRALLDSLQYWEADNSYYGYFESFEPNQNLIDFIGGHLFILPYFSGDMCEGVLQNAVTLKDFTIDFQNYFQQELANHDALQKLVKTNPYDLDELETLTKEFLIKIFKPYLADLGKFKFICRDVTLLKKIYYNYQTDLHDSVSASYERVRDLETLKITKISLTDFS